MLVRSQVVLKLRTLPFKLSANRYDIECCIKGQEESFYEIFMASILRLVLNLSRTWNACTPHTLRSACTKAESATSSLDPHEAAKFSALSSHWWDPNGPFAPLHRLNPARCLFIRNAVCSARGIEKDMPEPLTGMHVLDVGCGGGILAESMARMGAQVPYTDEVESRETMSGEEF